IPAGLSWRQAGTRGFASGVGFGIAEAIMYAGDYYNGISPAGIYIVRFVSCVALHGIWTAAVGLFLHKHQHLLQGDLEWHELIVRILFLVSVPMILHGFYDTLLKKDMAGLALIPAIVSFGWLVWCVEKARSTEPTPGRKRRLKTGLA